MSLLSSMSTPESSRGIRRRAIAMITSAGVAGAISSSGGSAAIRPFRIHVADADLVDLKQRLKATRLARARDGERSTQGIRLATMQALVHYWETEYARSMRTRCRSSLPMGGPARSSSS